jgi:archaellum component FlaC
MPPDEQTNALLRDLISHVSDINKSVGSLEASVENLSHNAGKTDTTAASERHDMSITITDIRGKIGEIESRLAVGTERHRDFAQSLDRIEARTGKIEIEVSNLSPLTITVAEMKPQVKELMDFKGRMAAIMVIASSLIGTAAWFAWEGLKWLFPNVKALFTSLFH